MWGWRSTFDERSRLTQAKYFQYEAINKRRNHIFEMIRQAEQLEQNKEGIICDGAHHHSRKASKTLSDSDMKPIKRPNPVSKHVSDMSMKSSGTRCSQVSMPASEISSGFRSSQMSTESYKTAYSTSEGASSQTTSRPDSQVETPKSQTSPMGSI